MNEDPIDQPARKDARPTERYRIPKFQGPERLPGGTLRDLIEDLARCRRNFFDKQMKEDPNAAYDRQRSLNDDERQELQLGRFVRRLMQWLGALCLVALGGLFLWHLVTSLEFLLGILLSLVVTVVLAYIIIGVVRLINGPFNT